MKSDELYNHLKFISTILKQKGIKHWITYGTLLGAVRDKDIIPYDYDFDIGAKISDVDRILSLNSMISKVGYQLKKKHSYGYSFDNPKRRRMVWRVSIKILFNGEEVGDIYLYRRFSDGFMRRFDVTTGTYFWAKGTYPAWFTDELIQVRIRDSIFPAPQSPHVLLRHWYGLEWTVPIKAMAQGGDERVGYDYYGGDTNIKLKHLTEYLRITKNINLVPTIDYPIRYIFPRADKEWIKDNENQKII